MYSQEDLLLYGVDIDGPISTEDDSEAVVVPATANPLQPHYLQVLQQELQPHEASWDNIVHIYAATRTFVQKYGGTCILGTLCINLTHQSHDLIVQI